MEYSFKSTSEITLELKPGSTKSKLLTTKFNLECSDNLDISNYVDKEGFVTADGSKVLSNVLIQGLIGNIHMSHQKGVRNDAEHLRWIISELERGFIENMEVGLSTF